MVEQDGMEAYGFKAHWTDLVSGCFDSSVNGLINLAKGRMKGKEVGENSCKPTEVREDGVRGRCQGQ